MDASILGRSYAVTLPDYAAREELVSAYGEASKRGGSALMRVYAALLGLSTRIGRESGADYAAARFDVLAYGGAVYGYLREKGAAPKDVAAAAMPVLVAIVEATFPKQTEVDEALGKSPAGVAP